MHPTDSVRRSRTDMRAMGMRLMTTTLTVLLLLVGWLNAESNSSDPDSLDAVRVELQLNSGGRRVTHSWSQKRLVLLGDRMSIAIVKILDEQDLKNPGNVSSFLPLIRTSFSNPQFVSIESDKEPKVTFLLLQYLRQNVEDAQVQQEIEQTIEFVREKTAQGK
jgi:hypothetical protein